MRNTFVRPPVAANHAFPCSRGRVMSPLFRFSSLLGLSALLLVAAWRQQEATAQTGSVTISVDANANRRAIDPRIYGVAHASSAALAELNAPLNRNGGNNTSRYNWQLNCDNRGQDWYFESIPESSAVA